MAQARTLVVLFREPLELHLLADVAEEAITAGGKNFMDQTSSSWEGWAGHYDWLRFHPNVIAGVRCWLDVLDEDAAYRLLHAIADNAAVESTQHELRIWFSTERRFDEALSSDQDLGTHRVMVSSDGEAALTFDLDALTADELASVGGRRRAAGGRRYVARWHVQRGAIGLRRAVHAQEHQGGSGGPRL